MFTLAFQKLLVAFLATGVIVAGTVCRCPERGAAERAKDSCQVSHRDCCVKHAAGHNWGEKTSSPSEKPCDCPECRTIAAPEPAPEKGKLSHALLVSFVPPGTEATPYSALSSASVRVTDAHRRGLRSERTLLALASALNS